MMGRNMQMAEPPRRLRAALERQGLNETDFRVMQHGEVWSPRSSNDPDSEIPE